jgi:glycosyltransferase involved in cell wall biosynthesis
MQTITAVNPARNEEENIVRCIKSLQWCDHIIVLFSGNDETGNLARKLSSEVITYKFKREDSFKDLQKHFNTVIKNADTDWIFRVDADEVVTPELKKEIQKILKKTSVIVAFGIPRKQYFFGTFLKGGDWSYDRLVRLFKRNSAYYYPIVQVHEQLAIKGPVGYLHYALLHYSHPNLDVLLRKFNLYTTLEMKQLSLTKSQALMKLIFLPPYIFLRWMIWHKGYVDGLAGILSGFYRALYDFLLYSKYIEYKMNKKTYK